ncbi:MAG TPA: protein arginine kinase [Pseudogracilibacillus sp.]|nr:protein arginine kinase [Pseudogracilibacillus sp.]
MSLDDFIDNAISPWMHESGPENDIVLSTRIRLARNFADEIFPLFADEESLRDIVDFFSSHYLNQSFRNYKNFQLIEMNDLQTVEKRTLVEKHLVSPNLVKYPMAAVLLSENEQMSVMINEEDHIRMQLYFPGFQLTKALDEAFLFDDWLEKNINYAFDEEKGYLTSCPTNVGTGMRASVMIHLPGLVVTKRLNRLVPAINQLGFVVRGMYGEGSEAQGNIFQISNQVTLGQSEEDIVDDLNTVISKLVEQERDARQQLMNRSQIHVEDRIFRSFGILRNARIIESKEAAKRISDVRLGIDLGVITDLSSSILNDLMVLMQPGFLQRYAEKSLSASERDVLRASLIRERISLEEE